MAHLFLALFLIVFGLSVPLWVTGLLALLAGVILVLERFVLRADRK